MELKVWCDGIQRVVCGVNSQTTCQDVVFALAHATAQTGRFILIEKWRNSERLLAPSEHPIHVLNKWGEYANDVTFVMKKSEIHSKANPNLSLSPQSSTPSSSSATSPQHMLTTTGSGISSPNKRDFLHLFNTNIFSSVNKTGGFQHISGSSTPSTVRQLTSNTQNSSNSTPNASPLKSNSCLNSSHNSNNNNNVNNNTNNKTAIDSMASDLMANKQQMNNKNNNSVELSPTKSTAILGNRPRYPPPYSEAISKSAMISSGGQTNNSSSSHLISPTDTIYATNKRRSAEPSPQSQKQKTGGSQKDSILQRDAIRLVDMQKETIVSQEKEMSSLEQQISSIEKRLLKNEVLVKRYKDEMEACHQLWLDQEVMIDQLGDQQRLEQELDQLVATANGYEEEMIVLKKKLSQCETDIGDCRQQITKLMDQLENDQRMVRDKAIDKEEKDRQSVEQLKKALREKNHDLDVQKNDLQSLSNNIKQLDSILSEKTSEVDRLLADIKEANIQGLALQTADEKQRHNSGAGNSFHQRSGSTRKMIGSPRQLENAVATNKNPHGVWV